MKTTRRSIMVILLLLTIGTLGAAAKQEVVVWMWTAHGRIFLMGEYEIWGGCSLGNACQCGEMTEYCNKEGATLAWNL